jgi:hypothetical protein
MNGPYNVSTDDDFVGRDAACHRRALTDDDMAAFDVAFDNAVDLDFALADQIAGNGQIAADD